MNLNGRVVVVTGSSRGIGRVYACTLAAAGATVIVTGRSVPEVNETFRAIESAGGCALPVSFDVADPEGVQQAFDEIHTRLGPIDVLINNAGVSGPIDYLWDADASSWWRTMEIHVRGTFLCSRAALPGMIQRGGGRIINIVSHAGVFRWPTASAYSVSKAAVIKLTENLAVELRQHNIPVFAFHPGLVDGGLTHAAIAMDAPPNSSAYRTKSWVSDQVAAGHAVSAGLGAETILSLASGRGDPLSGRYITVFDDLTSLAANAETIRRDDLLTLRLRKDTDHAA